MRTAENQGIDVILFKFMQISPRDIFRHAVFPKSLFDERYKQRACLAYHGDLGIDLVKIFAVDTPFDRTFRSNDTDVIGSCRIGRHNCARLNYPNDRDLNIRPDLVQSKGAGRITCYHNSLHLFGLQKTYDLLTIFTNGFL